MQNAKLKKSKIFNFQFSIFNSCGAGFTLLEVLVAFTLLSVALVVVFQLFSANIKGVAASDDYVNAVIRAESMMREILDDDKLTEKSWEETTEDGYEIDAAVTSAENERTENLGVDLLEITLTIRWTKGIKQRALTLKTLKVVEKQI